MRDWRTACGDKTRRTRGRSTSHALHRACARDPTERGLGSAARLDVWSQSVLAVGLADRSRTLILDPRFRKPRFESREIPGQARFRSLVQPQKPRSYLAALRVSADGPS
jgi:hypothetical protein